MEGQNSPEWQEFQSAFRNQNREERVAIALRAALRVWPILLTQAYENLDKSGIGHTEIALLAARALLSARVAIDRLEEAVENAVRLAASSAHAVTFPPGGPVILPLLCSSEVAFAAYVEVVTKSYSHKAIDAAMVATRLFGDAVFNNVLSDQRSGPIESLQLPLWCGSEAPEQFEEIWKLAAQELSKGACFEFWVRWYDSMVRGAPMDWELQRRVALIPQEVWEAGADAVAGAIAEIEARFEVQNAAADLMADRDVGLVDSRLGIGGNSPPEAIEVPAEVMASQTIIWAVVNEIAEEAEAEIPDKARLAATLDALKSALGVCLKWAGRKADLAVDTVIKVGIPASGAAFIAANPAKVQALIQAVENWLPLLK